MFFGFIVIGCLTRLFMNRRVYWDKRCFVLFLFFVFFISLFPSCHKRCIIILYILVVLFFVVC